MQFTKRILLATSILTICVPHVIAQEATEEEPAARRLSSVTVTAQKREQNQQDVPIAISAATGETLDDKGIRSSDDLAFITPSVNVRRQTGASLVFIRGVGTAGGQAAQEGAVATFVDGVYQPSPQNTTQALFNLERVEVLKGPQGTLFGRNATGGAIHYITADPSHETGGKFSIGYGNKNTLELNGYVTTGLTENVAVDFAAYYRNQEDGFGTNTTTGNDLYRGEDLAFKTKALIDFSPDTSLTLGADYVEYSGTEGIYQNAVSTSTLVDGTMGRVGGFHDANLGLDPNFEYESFGGFAELEHNFGNVTLKSITGYRETDAQTLSDIDITPLPILQIDPLIEIADQFSQEFQLVGGSDNFEWILGAFYLDSEVGYTEFNIGGLGLTAIGLNRNQLRDSIQETESIAAFGQATIGLGEHYNLTLGGRFTRDERSFSAGLFGDLFDPMAPPAFVPLENANFVQLAPDGAFDASITFEEPTWRISLDREFGEDVLGYISYNRGFKSGIYNTTDPTAAPVEPEILDAYEAGLKSTLFDGRLRLNSAVFLYEYDNIQLITQVGASQLLLNAAEAEILGVEAEFEALLSDQLTISGGLSLLDSEYKSFPSAPNLTPNSVPPFGNIPGTADASGQTLVYTPDFSANILANYVFDTPLGEIETNLAYAYSGDFAFTVDGNGRLSQDAYGILNASVEVPIKENLSLRLWGRNLSDEEFFVSAFAQSIGDSAVPGSARTYGLTLVAEF